MRCRSYDRGGETRMGGDLEFVQRGRGARKGIKRDRGKIILRQSLIRGIDGQKKTYVSGSQTRFNLFSRRKGRSLRTLANNETILFEDK